MNKALPIYALAILLITACGRDVATGRRCQGAECSAGAGRGGTGGFGNVSGTSGASGSVAHHSNELTVRVEDIEEMTIEIITIQCAGECADVVAVAQGGNAPYTFAWEDGSIEPRRRVCPSASAEYSVSATDTAIETDEFRYDAHTATARVTAVVLECPEDAGVDGGDLPSPTCEGDAVAADVSGALVYFDDGAVYPAGRYRITHLDGCMKFGPPVDWTVNNLGVGTLLIGETSDVQLGVLPGIAGLGVTAFEDCVAMSRNEPPLEIDFAGGMLGVFLFDYPYDDNIEGEDGRNPTWCLRPL